MLAQGCLGEFSGRCTGLVHLHTSENTSFTIPVVLATTQADNSPRHVAAILILWFSYFSGCDSSTQISKEGWGGQKLQDGKMPVLRHPPKKLAGESAQKRSDVG